jgi:hypothetical protein
MLRYYQHEEQNILLHKQGGMKAYVRLLFQETLWPRPPSGWFVKLPRAKDG